MPYHLRAGHMDVTNTVNVTDPNAVARAVKRLLERCYPGQDFRLVDTLVQDLAALYRGQWPGYQACDVKYHDLQHVLDVTLAMARLLDGHDNSQPRELQLGPELALTGIACALFHDAGYIRRAEDRRYPNGGAYTRIHVSRGARLMSGYLPTVGLADAVPICRRIIHFTGYEVNPEFIRVGSEKERVLGSLLGTADLIAQMSDANYLQKCRDHLYDEFEAGGMAGEYGFQSSTGTVFRSPQHLLEATPEFIENAIVVRLDGYFRGAYHFAGEHFGGPNHYMEAVQANNHRLQSLLAEGSTALERL